MSAADRMRRMRERKREAGLISVRVEAATEEDAEKIRALARALLEGRETA